MPDLRRVLNDYDLGLLRVVAELWGVELEAGAQREAAAELAARLLVPELAAEVATSLPPEPRTALAELAAAGRLPLATFARRWGEVRAMGTVRRDRERPWANTPTATEALWYRALAGRAFFDEGRGPEEFLFVPDDLRPLIPLPPPAAAGAPAGRPAPAPAESAPSGLAGHDVVTTLAYAQVHGLRLEAISPPALAASARAGLAPWLQQPEAAELWLTLVIELGLAEAPNAGASLKLRPERVEPFLRATPAAQARELAEAWRATRAWNDLRQVPGLEFEGTGWRNDPAVARAAVLGLLGRVPPGEWWSLDSFVAAVKARQPDYQRPGGDYDSWYIRGAATGAYLRGFEHWEAVDGALVRWLITRPGVWLGLVEVDAKAAGSPGAAGDVPFRQTPLGAALTGQASEDAAAAPAPAPAGLELLPDATVRVPPGASAYDRFQLARIGAWLLPEAGASRYRLTPAALARAAAKGIRPERVTAFLEERLGEAAALPAVLGAVRRWQRHGGEAALREVVVLQLASADLLDTLRHTPGIRDELGESLGPDTVLVRREAMPRLRAALVSLGLLVDE
jgi:hypothetical protein